MSRQPIKTQEEAEAILNEMVSAFPDLARWWAPRLGLGYVETLILIMGAVSGKTMDVIALSPAIPRSPYYVGQKARELVGFAKEGGRPPGFSRWLARYEFLLEFVASESERAVPTPPRKLKPRETTKW